MARVCPVTDTTVATSIKHQAGDSLLTAGRQQQFYTGESLDQLVLYTVNDSVRGFPRTYILPAALCSVTKILQLYSREWTNYNRNIRWS